MEKGLTVPKWVLTVRPNIPQMPQNLFTQFFYPKPKHLAFRSKKALQARVSKFFFFFRLKKLRIVIFKTSFQDGTKVEVSSEIKPPLFRQVKSRQIRLGLTWHQIIQEHAIFYCVCIGAALVYRTLLCQSTQKYKNQKRYTMRRD